MKRALLLALVPLLAISTASRADFYSYQPVPADLYDLDHAKAYTWGIQLGLPADQVVQSAYLSFKQLRDDTTNDRLYIHLLDTAPLGVTVLSDPVSGNSDYFGSQGILLTVFANVPSTASDRMYTLTAAQVATLNQYGADGRIGIGLDPDCHYYNCGVTLGLCTTAVPEPATMAFLAVGGGMMLFRRVRRGRQVA